MTAILPTPAYFVKYIIRDYVPAPAHCPPAARHPAGGGRHSRWARRGRAVGPVTPSRTADDARAPSVANGQQWPATDGGRIRLKCCGSSMATPSRHRCGLAGTRVTTKVRLRGIDAPELRAHCPEERTRAEAAREALRAMLAEGDIAINHVSLDKYGGRVVADAARAQRRTYRPMSQGFAALYGGGRRAPVQRALRRQKRQGRRAAGLNRQSQSARDDDRRADVDAAVQSVMSALNIRMQPCDTKPPIEPGELVP